MNYENTRLPSRWQDPGSISTGRIHSRTAHFLARSNINIATTNYLAGISNRKNVLEWALSYGTKFIRRLDVLSHCIALRTTVQLRHSLQLDDITPAIMDE